MMIPILLVSASMVHAYAVLYSCPPNFPSCIIMIQQIFDKIGQSIKNTLF